MDQANSEGLGLYAREIFEKVSTAPFRSRTRIGKHLYAAAARGLLNGDEVVALKIAARARYDELTAQAESDRPWTPSGILNGMDTQERGLDHMEAQLPIGDRDEHLAA